MWPELVRVPYLDISVSSYGVLMVVGIVAGIALASYLARRDGIDPERACLLWLAVAAVSLLGARAAWFANHPGLAGPDDVLAGRARPGALLYGGLLVGLAASPLVARLLGVDWVRAADAAAPGVALGIAFGKVGCFAAGCCWGRACDEPWGVVFPVRTLEVSGAPMWTRLHPVQLYEAALALVVAIALVALYRRRAFVGEALLGLFVLFPLARFAVEFFRGDDRGELFGLAHATGLSPSQLVSLALVSLALGLWTRVRASDASRDRRLEAQRRAAAEILP